MKKKVWGRGNCTVLYIRKVLCDKVVFEQRLRRNQGKALEVEVIVSAKSLKPGRGEWAEQVRVQRR